MRAPRWLLGASVALVLVGAGAPAAAADARSVLADRRFGFCHDERYPLTEGEAAWLVERRREESATATSESAPVEHSAAARKAQKREQAERRRQLQPLREQLLKLERQLDELHQQQARLELTLADASIYQPENKDELRAKLAEKATLDRRLTEVEERWFSLSETLESEAE